MLSETRKTKIICTMGPATDDDNVLRLLIEGGMNVARINMSHGTHEEQKVRIDKIKKLREELGMPVAILLDTKGPEIRTGNFKNGRELLQTGQIFTFTTNECLGDNKCCSITFKGLPKDLKTGDKILVDDGLIEMVVQNLTKTSIECKVVNEGYIASHKGINVPGVSLSLPFISDVDKADIAFGVEQDLDFIAASFTRTPEDIFQLRQELALNNCDNMRIVAKIENEQGVQNIDEIIRASDGIMVARGDMGVEIPAEQVPHIQKEIIKKCNAAYKTVITATQMLDSMIRNPRPTRAEVTDVANAIYDGTDVVMLSGETANGKYPLEALKMMVKIAETTEQDLPKKYADYAKLHTKRGVSSAVTNATVQTAENLNAKAIVCPTISGFTARLASKLKPDTQIVGCSPYDAVLRKMQIYWGVRPVKTAIETSTDKIIEHALVTAENAGYIGEGDVVIVSAGIATNSSPTSKRGLTNTMRVVTI